MKLKDLIDENWNSYEKDRFLKDDTKIKTDRFDPESFKHDGFEDREEYLETYVPALAAEERIRNELTNFTPPRLSAINGSPYQALVIRYGILHTLIQQSGYNLEKEQLIDAVQNWQREIITGYGEDIQFEDELLHLAKAAVNYGSDIYDQEINMIYSYFDIYNTEQKWNHDHYTWPDFFARLSSIGRFPKVSRSENPEHAMDTIEKGIWSLQEQALVYEVRQDDEDIVGIPEDYISVIKEWLPYEMSKENLSTMLETLEPFDNQTTLIEARKTFGVDTKTQGYNNRRRESLVEAGISPYDLLDEALTKEELKNIVDTYGLDAHKRKRNEMINATIEYFEQSQKAVDSGSEEPDADVFLSCFEDIADGNIQSVPPQIQQESDSSDLSRKLDVLFERGTAEIFSEILNLEATTWLGQSASGVVADGEIEQDGDWLLWDNKRRLGKYKLNSNDRSKIKNYIETKNQQHDVEWFVIIAPDFTDQAKQNAIQMEKQIGIDIRLLRAEKLKELAEFWRDSFGEQTFPLKQFFGSGFVDVEVIKQTVSEEFA